LKSIGTVGAIDVNAYLGPLVKNNIKGWCLRFEK
jgi:hypothetical protein